MRPEEKSFKNNLSIEWKYLPRAGENANKWVSDHVEWRQNVHLNKFIFYFFQEWEWYGITYLN